jgi:hypothetical protein
MKRKARGHRPRLQLRDPAPIRQGPSMPNSSEIAHAGYFAYLCP